MSEPILCNTFNLQQHPTEITFELTTSQTDCSFFIEDTTKDFNPPFSFGFLPEENNPYPEEIFQYKRSWGYFLNVIYWNKYNRLTGKCEAQLVSTTLIYENGSQELYARNYSFGRDGYFTIYRIFILKKSKFEEDLKDLYRGSQVIVYNDLEETPTTYIQMGYYSDPSTVIYEDVASINDVVLLFENQTSNLKLTGTLSKKDFVSVCYLQKCYEGINILLIEQLSNPCLNNPASFYENSGRSLFGYNSVNCLAIYNNPNMFKRDFLFMLLTLLRLLVDRCEFCHAEKLIEEIIGTSTTAKCSLLTYLCGDTLVANEITSGCGCR